VSRPPAAARGTPTLVAAGLRLDRGASAVLRDVSFVVGPGMRLGVVGPNGVGKSTLLRLLAGELRPDAGSVRLQPPGTVVGYLAQEPRHGPADSVRQVLHRATGVAAAEAALGAAASALAAGQRGAGDRYDAALARLASLAPDDLDARLDAVLDDLGLGAVTADRPMAALSGGQRARVGLAAVVLSRFGVTLLDEPTNDLDFDGLARL
jgi:ATPase subunit of ABC transporter with duplicated ATPase domains